jgi:glycosyltransferase involved in cell wall biosynthesis
MHCKVCILTNIPSPYRVLLFDELAKNDEFELCLIYYRHNESNRKWALPKLMHRAIFLNESTLSKINFHQDILSVLLREKPDVIIAAGFTISIIIAFLFAKAKRKKFIVFTDSWLHSVNNLKKHNRFIRKHIIPKADASICVGQKGKEFLNSYGAKTDSIFKSPLAIDNEYYHKYYIPIEKKKFDFIFSGQFINRKMPFFVIDILKRFKKRNGQLKFLLIGSGPLENDIITELTRAEIEFEYPGFIQQKELPKYYASAKLLLFPTLDDPWGLVANEACAVGTPVITCGNAGVASDLILHDFNGYVLPLVADVWVSHIENLLNDFNKYNQFSKNAMLLSQNYSIAKSAEGILRAINFAMKSHA